MNKVNEMERKVTKFGNSLGLTMSEALRQIGLDAGDIVTIDVRGNNDEIVIKKAKKVTLPSGISHDFMDTLSQVIEQYDETIKGLKDR
ncbi:AbrB family transcriptional regulator [Cohnella sp. GCM10027633]|uniref:AbrB/MazE/SpoVT family DNA-binding domain-containing protein n=1 Tax=unclassified Cohnella TaxID=2636738 RepID=UPI00362E5938